MTPSGRFETNTKVCLSFSAYHPELWQPAWGIRLILEALVSFLPTKGDGAIGALDWTDKERKRLAKKSVDFCCPACGKCSDILKRIEQKIAKRGNSGGSSSKAKSMFQKEIEQLHAMQMTNQVDQDATIENSDDEEGKNEMINEEEGVNTTVEEKDSEQVVKEIDEEVSPGEESCEKLKEEDTGGSGIEKEGAIPEVVAQDRLEEEAKPPNDEVQKVEAPQIDQVQAAESESLEQAALGDQEEREHLQSPLLSDPVIHTGIVVFSIIVWLLVRKLTAIIEDMHALETEIRELR